MRNFVRGLWININLLERSEVLVYVLVLFIFTLLLVIFGQNKKSRLFEGGGFYRAQLIKGKSIKKYEDQKELMDGLRGFDLGLGKRKDEGSVGGLAGGSVGESAGGSVGESVGESKEEKFSKVLKGEALRSEAIKKAETGSATGVKGLGVNVGDGSGVKWMIYTVKRGDFLVRIGNRFQVSLGVILKHNKIRDPNLIYRGQKIRIPIDWEDGVSGKMDMNEQK